MFETPVGGECLVPIFGSLNYGECSWRREDKADKERVKSRSYHEEVR